MKQFPYNSYLNYWQCTSIVNIFTCFFHSKSNVIFAEIRSLLLLFWYGLWLVFLGMPWVSQCVLQLIQLDSWGWFITLGELPPWLHDDVIEWKHFPLYWPFVWGIHRSPVNSSHKGQWRGALMLSLICVWINDWVNSREVADLRRHHTHYDVIVMISRYHIRG